MHYKEKDSEKLPKRSTPQVKFTMDHITSTPMSFTTPDHRYPATNLGIPSDEGVGYGRKFDEENIK